MKNLLLFRLGGLGDLLVSFPSIYLLRKSLACSCLTLVCRRDYGMILKEVGVVDEVISAEERRLSPFFSGGWPFHESLRGWLQEFDGILGWMQKKKGLKVDPSWLLSHKKNFRFFAYNDRSGESVSWFFFHRTKRFLQEKGEKTFPFKECIHLPFRPSPEEAFLGGGLVTKEKIVVIHPGSGSREKCWPFRNFLRIIQRVNQSGVKGMLVSGPADDWIEDEWD